MKQNLVFWLIAWLLTSWPAMAKTFWVDTTGVIQDTIEVAGQGDTIRLRPGYYEQGIFVNKAIVLTGCNFLNTIIHPLTGPAIIVADRSYVSCLTLLSNTEQGAVIYSGKIKNCVIQGCADANNINCSGIKYLSQTALVANCLIQNNGYYGIYGHGGNWIKITAINNVFRNNKSYAGYSYDDTKATADFNCYYQNGTDGWAWSGGDFQIGSNLIADPLLDNNYLPLPNSPLLNRGDTSLFNPDGSRSDIGVYGGPDSCHCDVSAGVEDSRLEQTEAILIAPNPVISGDVAINYQLTNNGPVTIAINNFLGQTVAVPLKNQWQTIGPQQSNFSLANYNLASGSYIIIVKTAYKIMAAKLMIIK